MSNHTNTRAYPAEVLHEAIVFNDDAPLAFDNEVYHLKLLRKKRGGKRRWSEVTTWYFEDLSDNTLWEVSADIPLTENSGEFGWQGLIQSSNLVLAHRVIEHTETVQKTTYVRAE